MGFGEIHTIIFLFLSHFCNLLFCAEPGDSNYNFLKIGMNARPISMGESFVPIAEGAGGYRSGLIILITSYVSKLDSIFRRKSQFEI